MAVMMVHAGVPGFKTGWIGVDVFFVLSGFLITTLLAQEYQRTMTINLGKFAVRRAARLMPAYLLYIAPISLAIWFWPGSVRSVEAGWDATDLTVSLWTYTTNFLPLGGIWSSQGLTIHLWSLAVEQQYYLAWPLLLLLMAIKCSRVIALFGVLMAILFFGLLVAYTTAQLSGVQASTMLFTRGFSLVLASGVAWHLAQPGASWMKVRWLAHVDLLALVVALFALALPSVWPDPVPHEDILRILILPVLVPTYLILIAKLWYVGPAPWSAKVLEHPVMVYVGVVSYGVYLFHEVVRVTVWKVLKPLMHDWPQHLGFGTRLVVYIVLSVGLASLSYYFWELPINRRAREFLKGSPSKP